MRLVRWDVFFLMALVDVALCFFVGRRLGHWMNLVRRDPFFADIIGRCGFVIMLDARLVIGHKLSHWMQAWSLDATIEKTRHSPRFARICSFNHIARSGLACLLDGSLVIGCKLGLWMRLLRGHVTGLASLGSFI